MNKKVFAKTGGPGTSGLYDKLCVMLPVTEVVVIVTTVRYPQVFATNRGKVIYHRDANPCEKRTALGRRHESERSWVHIPVLARIFSDEISVKVRLLDHLVAEFVNYKSMSCTMYQLSLNCV